MPKIFSNDMLNGMKTAVEVPGRINEGQVLLMSLLDIQSKNLFEILMFPQNIGFNLSILTAAMDTAVTKFHIQKISIEFPSFEYTAVNDIKYLSGITYPETVTISFIENEAAIIRNYINTWVKDIAFPAILPGKSGYIFKKDQNSSKKNAILMLQSGQGLPTAASVKLEGLKFKSWPTLDLDQADGTGLIMDITFAVDSVHWMTFF